MDGYTNVYTKKKKSKKEVMKHNKPEKKHRLVLGLSNRRRRSEVHFWLESQKDSKKIKKECEET